MDNSKDARSGRVLLFGRPNVGKSTLLNALVGEHLAIVSKVPQTTRQSFVGVYVEKRPPTQIALIDTPGLHRPENKLGKMLMEQAEAATLGIDVALMITDAPTKRGADPRDVERLDDIAFRYARSIDVPLVLAINKADLLSDKGRLLPFLQAYDDLNRFKAVVPIAAKQSAKLDVLVRALREYLPEGKLFDDDVITEQPMRFFAKEFVREALLERLRDELPHQLGVYIERYQEEGKLTRIDATIIVSRDGQKKIVIGQRGALLKEVGIQARTRIEKLTGSKVMLTLWVKVVPGWTDNTVHLNSVLSEV